MKFCFAEAIYAGSFLLCKRSKSHLKFRFAEAIYVGNIFCFAKNITSGAWLSLVERCVRDAEVAGSNPVAPIPWQGHPNS